MVIKIYFGRILPLQYLFKLKRYRPDKDHTQDRDKNRVFDKYAPSYPTSLILDIESNAGKVFGYCYSSSAGKIVIRIYGSAWTIPSNWVQRVSAKEAKASEAREIGLNLKNYKFKPEFEEKLIALGIKKLFLNAAILQAEQTNSHVKNHLDIMNAKKDWSDFIIQGFNWHYAEKRDGQENGYWLHISNMKWVE